MLALIGKDVLQMLRDRSVLIMVFLVPLAMAGITSAAFSEDHDRVVARLGVVDDDRGSVARLLVEEVFPSVNSGSGSPVLELHEHSTAAAARDSLAASRDDAVMLIPSQFTRDVLQGRAVQVTLLVAGTDEVARPLAQSVLAGFASQTQAGDLSVVLTTTGSGAQRDSEALRQAARSQRSPITITSAVTDEAALTSTGYFAPSMLVLALLFAGQITARSLIGEARTRTLGRIVLSGTAPWRIVLAKYAVAFGVGLLSSVVVLGVFARFGTRFGDLPVLALLVTLAATAMIAVSSLVVLMVRGHEQASALGGIVVFVLAILGGNFVPLAQTSGALESLARLTPNGWAVRGFVDLATASGGALDAVGLTLLVLLGFTVVAGLPVLLLSQRLVRTADA